MKTRSKWRVRAQTTLWTRTYRPLLETLEHRLPPGDAVVGGLLANYLLGPSLVFLEQAEQVSWVATDGPSPDRAHIATSNKSAQAPQEQAGLPGMIGDSLALVTRIAEDERRDSSGWQYATHSPNGSDSSAAEEVFGGASQGSNSKPGAGTQTPRPTVAEVPPVQAMPLQVASTPPQAIDRLETVAPSAPNRSGEIQIASLGDVGSPDAGMAKTGTDEGVNPLGLEAKTSQQVAQTIETSAAKQVNGSMMQYSLSSQLSDKTRFPSDLSSTEAGTDFIRFVDMVYGSRRSIKPFATPPSTQDVGTPDAFIAKMYTQVLGKMPDDEGGWQAWINSFTSSGCNAATLKVAGQAFFQMSDYTQLSYDNGAKVMTLYRGVLNREPESSGFTGYLNQLNDGVPFSSVIEQVFNSPEFADLVGPICKRLFE